jgi:hypothetical protein
LDKKEIRVWWFEDDVNDKSKKMMPMRKASSDWMHQGNATRRALGSPCEMMLTTTCRHQAAQNSTANTVEVKAKLPLSSCRCQAAVFKLITRRLRWEEAGGGATGPGNGASGFRIILEIKATRTLDVTFHYFSTVYHL